MQEEKDDIGQLDSDMFYDAYSYVCTMSARITDRNTYGTSSDFMGKNYFY